MVGIPFLGNRKRGMTELEAAVANGVAQTAAGRHSGDEEQRRLMAENFVLLTDPGITSLLDGMGKYDFTDTAGVLGDKGAKYTGARPKYIAARLLNSSLIRGGWLSEQEAKIMKLRVHALFIRIKMKMSEEEYEEGGGLVMDAVEQLVDVNINSSVNGRMAKLVKSRPASIDVAVGPPNEMRNR